MVQISTPWGDPQAGNGPPVRRFLSNYFDLLFSFWQTQNPSCLLWLFINVAVIAWKSAAAYMLNYDAPDLLNVYVAAVRLL